MTFVMVSNSLVGMAYLTLATGEPVSLEQPDGTEFSAVDISLMFESHAKRVYENFHVDAAVLRNTKFLVSSHKDFAQVEKVDDGRAWFFKQAGELVRLVRGKDGSNYVVLSPAMLTWYDAGHFNHNNSTVSYNAFYLFELLSVARGCTFADEEFGGPDYLAKRYKFAVERFSSEGLKGLQESFESSKEIVSGYQGVPELLAQELAKRRMSADKE